MSERHPARRSAARKAEAVLRLLRGEDLRAVGASEGVSTAVLQGWRERFLARGRLGLMARPRDPRDEEIRRLKARLGVLVRENEVLRQRARTSERKRPFPSGRSRP